MLTCDFPWFNRRPRLSFLEPYSLLRQTASELANQEFDVAINLRFDFWWGALLAYLAGIPEIVGYDRPGCGPFLTKALPYIPRCHEVEQNLRLVSNLLDLQSPLVPEARAYPLRFEPTPADEQCVDDLLARHAVPEGGRLIAIHPGAGAPVKLWTAAGFTALAQTLVEKHGVTVLITGSPAERALASEVAGALDGRNVIVVAGETSLGQLAALFRRCAAVIGVDSGPLHLAVAVGTPTVHLFGPSDPAAFGPYGDSARHAIVSAEMDCAPCGRLDIPASELDEHRCMLTIEAKQVLSAVEEILVKP